ncbi:FG-GAP repeat domain-containing protein [Paenarthrobacter sp. NPDC089675]|uniref:FG-GAP repeat domain-containing protein n=1 Tax=Paenarthrobacter sp. NPDC089675 TaxID=3364376 RepID=UPI00381ECB68
MIRGIRRRFRAAAASLLTVMSVGTIFAGPAPGDEYGWHNFIQMWWDKGEIYSDLLVVDDAGQQLVHEGGSTWQIQRLNFGSTTVPEANALLLPGDWDGDGYADWMFRNKDGSLFLRAGLEEGRGVAYTVQVGWGWDVMTALTSPGDWDGDGHPDVLARDAAGLLWLYRGDGAGQWLPGRTQVGWGWNVMTAVFSGHDFSGDGNPDVLARDSGGNLFLYPGNGAGGWLNRIHIGWGWQHMDQLTAPGDFDYDGFGDVLARDDAGQTWLYPGNGTGGFIGTRTAVDIEPPQLMG